MTELEMILGSGVLGASIMAALVFAFWLLFDMTKTYADREIREAKDEMRKYTRQHTERQIGDK